MSFRNWRFLGIDDSFKGKECVIVGCVTEGSSYVDGFMVGRVAHDPRILMTMFRLISEGIDLRIKAKKELENE